MSIDIVPIGQEHIEGFHATLDAVCRERAYLAFLALLFDAEAAVSDPAGLAPSSLPNRS